MKAEHRAWDGLPLEQHDPHAAECRNVWTRDADHVEEQACDLGPLPPECFSPAPVGHRRTSQMGHPTPSEQ